LEEGEGRSREVKLVNQSKREINSEEMRNKRSRRTAE
jgi:hypothetical protein